jgi:hypothetical protein
MIEHLGLQVDALDFNLVDFCSVHLCWRGFYRRLWWFLGGLDWAIGWTLRRTGLFCW